MARATKKQAEASTAITSIKGFDKNLQCRGYQFVPGKTFTVKGKARCCENGFHACPEDVHPLAVFGYYAPGTSRYFLVEQSGDICRREGDKAASTILTVNIEIGIGDLVKRAWDFVWSRCTLEAGSQATGYRGAASATGDLGAASATGDLGAASATGNRGAASATGTRGAAISSYEGRVMGAEGNALFAIERDDNLDIVTVASGIVGRDGIKANVWYVCRDSKLVEA